MLCYEYARRSIAKDTSSDSGCDGSEPLIVLATVYKVIVRGMRGITQSQAADGGIEEWIGCFVSPSHLSFPGRTSQLGFRPAFNAGARGWYHVPGPVIGYLG